jgi:hypothetical protein
MKAGQTDVLVYAAAEWQDARPARTRHGIRCRNCTTGNTMGRVAANQRGHTSRQYEEEAARWEETGKLQDAGRTPYYFVRMELWFNSRGAQVEGVSERLQRYYGAVKKEFDGYPEGWYDDFLSERDYCSGCGETFHNENLSFCTCCFGLFGYCCQPSGLAPNGNVLCNRCGKGEVVG